MGKLKTKKALQKRVKITGTSKVKRSRAGRRHLMRKKTSRRRLKLKSPAYVDKTDEKKIKQMLPHS